MKKLFNYIHNNSPKKSKATTDKEKKVLKATKLTLSQYAKTFKDLAQYDRTEKARS